MKILILGDGKLGNEFHKQTGWDFLSRKKNKIEVSNFDDWSYKLLNYDLILNCIANTNTYSELKNEHLEINFIFVSKLVNFCNQNQKKIVHISTDYVYGNSKSNASENDVPIHTNNWYSYTKLLADSHIEVFSNNYLILRLSHKENPFPFDSAWTNVKTNADHTEIITNLAIRIINADVNGIVNVGTPVKTIYELALKSNPNVQKILAPKKIPKNVTMNLKKMNEILKSKN
jgi:dTDP-4-dehydrorhamnose reductase